MISGIAIAASVAVAIGVVIAYGVVQHFYVRSRLMRLKNGRDGVESIQQCLAEFGGTDPERVRLAYRWVQELMAVEDFPLHLTDYIYGALRIDQGEVDDKFEACYECFGPEKDSGIQSTKPIETVKELMEAVLASGYEGYPVDKMQS